MRLATVAGFAALLAGCGLITAPTEEDRLTTARRLWTAAALQDYRYEVRSVCECLQGGRWIEVTVLAGKVSSGAYLDTHTQVETAYLPALPTIPALFDRIQHAINQSAVLLEVDYDVNDGHPITLDVDISRTIADEEFSLQSRHLTALVVTTASLDSR